MLKDQTMADEDDLDRNVLNALTTPSSAVSLTILEKIRREREIEQDKQLLDDYVNKQVDFSTLSLSLPPLK